MEQKTIVFGKCDWCQMEGANYSGGFRNEFGDFSGNFCCKEHFKLWVAWENAYIRWLKGGEKKNDTD